MDLARRWLSGLFRLSEWVARYAPDDEQRYGMKYCDSEITDHDRVLK